MLPHRFFQPVERLMLLAQRRIHEDKLVGIDKLVGRGMEQLFEKLLGLGATAGNRVKMS